MKYKAMTDAEKVERLEAIVEKLTNERDDAREALVKALQGASLPSLPAIPHIPYEPPRRQRPWECPPPWTSPFYYDVTVKR